MVNVDTTTLSWEGSNLFLDHPDYAKKFVETDIIKTVEFLIDNIFVMLDVCIFQQKVDISMGTNYDLLGDMFLYSHIADLIQGLLKENEGNLVRSFDFMFRYIDDILSLNNSKFDDFVGRIYPIEHAIKDTTYTAMCASYIHIHLEFDSGGLLRTQRFTKRDDFNFFIVNFTFMCSTIPAAPVYEVCTSQLMRYSRACGSYRGFLDRGALVTRKVFNQGFHLVKLKYSLRKYYSQHHDLVSRYGISISQMATDMFQKS